MSSGSSDESEKPRAKYRKKDELEFDVNNADKKKRSDKNGLTKKEFEQLGREVVAMDRRRKKNEQQQNAESLSRILTKGTNQGSSAALQGPIVFRNPTHLSLLLYFKMLSAIIIKVSLARRFQIVQPKQP